jgi:hypothetical protein
MEQTEPFRAISAPPEARVQVRKAAEFTIRNPRVGAAVGGAGVKLAGSWHGFFDGQWHGGRPHNLYQWKISYLHDIFMFIER